MKRILALVLLCATVSQVFPNSYHTAVSSVDSLLHVREVFINSRMTFRETAPSQMLKGQQLEKMGNSSVADALRFFSGIQVKDYGGVGGMKTVNIRSLGSQHLGIAYDGVILGNAQNGQIDLGQFSLDNVEDISLFNGQKNSIFLSASDFSNAGLVYIRSRRPVFSDGKSWALRLKAKAASSDTYRVSALYEQRISQSLSTSLSAEMLTSTGRYKFRYRTESYDTTATRRNGDIDALRAEANIYLSTPQGLTGSLKLYTYHSERGIPGAIASNVWSRTERQWDHNTFVQGYIQKTLTDKLTSRLTAKYAYYNTRYLNNDTTKLLIDNRYKQQEIFLSSSNIYELLPKWNASLSYDFRWNKLNSNMQGFVYPERFSNLISLASSLDLNQIKIQGSILATFINDHTDKGISPEPISSFTPAVFLSWYPFENGPLSLRAFAKKSFRMPTFNDLFYVDIGSANLEPETAIQYNIGGAYFKQWPNGLFSSFRLQADAYYNSIRDKIIAYPKGSQFRWTMLNLGKVHIHGLDVTADTKLSPAPHLSVHARLQYTWQHAVDVTNPNTSYYKDQLPYTPRHSGSALLSVSYRNTELCYSHLYSGERYSQQENITRNHMPAWHTCDISLSHTIRTKNNNLRITAEINNLFNKEYDVIRNFPMPLRNYAISIVYEYNH